VWDVTPDDLQCTKDHFTRVMSCSQQTSVPAPASNTCTLFPHISQRYTSPFLVMFFTSLQFQFLQPKQKSLVIKSCLLLHNSKLIINLDTCLFKQDANGAVFSCFLPDSVHLLLVLASLNDNFNVCFSHCAGVF